MVTKFLEEQSFYQAGKTLIQVAQMTTHSDELKRDCMLYGFTLEGDKGGVAMPSLVIRDEQYRYDHESSGVSRPDRILLGYHDSRLTHLLFN